MRSFLRCLCFVLCFSSIELCNILNASMIDSCSNQLWTNETEDACLIVRLGLNSCECLSPLLESPTNIINRGIIKIEPYKDIKNSRTIFNITAYNITWNNLKLRFHQQNTEKCMKREITIKKSVPLDKVLFYDKPWSSATFEDQIVNFEYALGVNSNYDGKRTFLIHVPKYEALKYFKSSRAENVTIFTYVETTKLYQLICKIHVAPKHLNVTSYEIKVVFKKNNVTRIDGPFVRDAEEANFDVIDFEYDTYGIPGEYVFHVKPYDCPKCRISMSPVVRIPESSTILTIGLVGVSFLIPILLVTFYMYYKVDSGLIPRVLLVTTPANNAHKVVGRSLANLLIEKFNIPTMIDIIDNPIPHTMPSDWFTKSFKYATHIVILIADDKPVTSIYRNTDNLLYSLIQGDPDKICCTIEFPFSKKTKLRFNVHRHFKLMDDYNAFINFIHNRGLLRKFIKKAIRNDLYNDLVNQIDNYKNDIHFEELIHLNRNDEECNAQNKINTNSEDQPKVSKEVQKCLDKSTLSDSNIIFDDSDESDKESITSLVQYSLEEVS